MPDPPTRSCADCSKLVLQLILISLISSQHFSLCHCVSLSLTHCQSAYLLHDAKSCSLLLPMGKMRRRINFCQNLDSIFLFLSLPTAPPVRVSGVDDKGASELLTRPSSHLIFISQISCLTLSSPRLLLPHPSFLGAFFPASLLLVLLLSHDVSSSLSLCLRSDNDGCTCCSMPADLIEVRTGVQKRYDSSVRVTVFSRISPDTRD